MLASIRAFFARLFRLVPRPQVGGGGNPIEPLDDGSGSKKG